MEETLDAALVRHTDRAHPALGIIGGGQLAKMTAMAGLRLGCDIVILERQQSGPAASLATHFITGDWNDAATLADFAGRVDVVTIENEFVDAARLAGLERAGATVHPGATALALVQDKFTQKTCLAEAGLAVAPFVAVTTPADVARAADAFGWPVVLKARRDGYDGRGNVTVRRPPDIDAAWRALGAERGRRLYVEAFSHFERELAIIVTRASAGATVVYPLVETVQRDHICHVVRAPASVPEDVAAAARALALRAVEVTGLVGSVGIELFLGRDGALLINEMAPRVHNSGHYTIEACLCSQFENHVRAVIGWPLGDAAMRAPAAVMVNLLGAGPGPGWPIGLADALAVPEAVVHLYGKSVSARGRKMGHVTATGQSIAEAEAAAMRAARALRFGGEP